MGAIIEMPIRSTSAVETPIAKGENSRRCAVVDIASAKSSAPAGPVAAETAKAEESAPVAPDFTSSQLDFSIWMNAPKERTAAYFPTYSAISRAMQATMRTWVREWFYANPEILLRPHSAYPILVFQCTHPFAGKPTNIFTYDIQQTTALNRAFASAASKLGAELKTLDTKTLAWFTREHYFAYRSKEVVKYVMKNRRAIYKMLNVETVLMDSILKFALIDIPKLGLEESVALLRRAFNTQLRRFSDDVDLSGRADDLLRIATEVLGSKLDEAPAVPAPKRTRKVVELPVREVAATDLPLAA